MNHNWMCAIKARPGNLLSSGSPPLTPELHRDAQVIQSMQQLRTAADRPSKREDRSLQYLILEEKPHLRQMQLDYILDTSTPKCLAQSVSNITESAPIPGNMTGAQGRAICKRFPCLVPDCDESFSQKSRALHHAVTKHPSTSLFSEKVFLCDLCENAFPRNSDLRKHIQCVHLRIRPYKCPKCSSAFFFRKDMLKHIRCIHDKVRDHECGKCGRRFGKKEHLNRHINVLHSPTRWTRYCCKFCDIKFSRMSDLQAHMTTAGHLIRASRPVDASDSQIGSLSPAPDISNTTSL